MTLMITRDVSHASPNSRLRLTIWMLPITVAILIFMFSAQTADESSALSNGVAGMLLRMIQGLHPSWRMMSTDDFVLAVSPYLRKGAHMIEHLALYISLLIAFRVSSVRCCPLHVMGLTFLNACSDELHQLFVPGRHGCFTDVLIDCSLAAIVTVTLCIFLITRNRKRTMGKSANESNIE